MVLSGTELSKKIKEEIREEISTFTDRQPSLVTILVGDDPASKVYVANKEKACNSVGITNITERLPESTTEQELLDLIERYNWDLTVDGILVQLPLPKHINSDKVISAIWPEKDVDGFHPQNVAKLWTRRTTNDCIVPCTPLGIMRLIEEADIDLEGKNVVVVGRSNIVGLPVAKLCLNANATVTVVHSKTKNLAEITRAADVLIVAIGKDRFVTDDMVKDGAVVIDVGINRVEGKLYGDVDFDSVSEKASYITPVPGGVGPMTICYLLYNTINCYKHNVGIKRLN